MPLLYLSTSVIPLLLMYTLYKTINIALTVFSTGISQAGMSCFWQTTSHDGEIIVLVLLSVSLLVIFSIVICLKSKQEQQDTFNYDSVSNLNSEAINYFLALALCLSTSNTLNYIWVWLLFVFISILSFRLNDYRVNLLLWFIGRRQYAISGGNSIEHIVITRKPLQNQSGSIKVIKIAGSLLWEIE